MSALPDPVHLNNRHGDTLEKIFQHPASHNIEWRSVLSLLEYVGTVEEEHDGHFLVLLGGERETFDRPNGKDIGPQMVVDLRRMLHAAGYPAADDVGDHDSD
jgi:hypothetical protein